MFKSTDELAFELANTPDIADYMHNNQHQPDPQAFHALLGELITASGLSKTKIATAACLSEPYLYNLIRGDKHPSRNKVLQLAFGLGIDMAQTERLLQLAGHNAFYTRNKRDALVQYALGQCMNIHEADGLLMTYGFSMMTE